MPTPFLYDKRGSDLFDEICTLDEYYVTRTELAILESNLPAIADAIGERALIIEPGSGTSTKTRFLLNSLKDPVGYVPVEISEQHLAEAAAALKREFPQLEILPRCADFTEPFEVPATDRKVAKRVVYFPGSTVGNFSPEGTDHLLQSFASDVGPGGAMLIGIDLHKDRAIVEAAYNDARGITAEFTMNMLVRCNAELGSDFDADAFHHQAKYDEQERRIVTAIVSEKKQTVQLAQHTIEFEEGEEIFAEYSHKFTTNGFAERAKRVAGFEHQQTWTDPDRLFAVQLYNQPS